MTTNWKKVDPLDPSTFADLFGRIRKDPDPRNRRFLAVDVLTEAPKVLRNFRTYKAMNALSQRGGTCVPHAGVHFEGCAPLMVSPQDRDDPYKLYQAVQSVDPWAGTPHEGSTIEALMKIFRSQGRVLSYHWSTSALEVRDWIIQFGTAILGIDWTADMMDIDADGFIHPTGPMMGGHAILCIGYSARLDAFRLLNSWGAGWGERGRCWIKLADLGELLARPYAECALGLEERIARTVLALDLIETIQKNQREVAEAPTPILVAPPLPGPDNPELITPRDQFRLGDR